jgi:hypothetical protein
MPVAQLIFTDLPRGSGLDPARAGYQIKVCSGDLDAQLREQLAAIAMHYGEAVYRYAPQAALDRETAWRAQAVCLDRVPDEVLGEFPIIWSYDRLRDNRYALTRVSYTGLTHDGRFGNFLSHALVFSPESLAAHGWNPLALARRHRFQDVDPRNETARPALSNLGSPDGTPPEASLLAREPYGGRLVAIVSALCTAIRAHRPVVFSLPDWRLAQPLVEAVLGLLPPSARCRTTVCTHESDRSWVASTGIGGQEYRAGAHQVLVLGGADQGLGLRPDEYQSTYTVFNFTSNQFSPPGEPSRFATFAAGCVLDGHLDRLQQYHELLEILEAGQDVQAWDDSVPATALFEEQPGPEAMAGAVRVLAAQIRQTHQAQRVLDQLWPHVQALDRTDHWVALGTLASDVSILADLLPAEPNAAPSPSFLGRVRRLTGRALLLGRARMAAALLNLCGQGREGFLLGLLSEALAGPPISSVVRARPDDQKQLLQLYLEGLRLVEKTPASQPSFAQLLRATYETACEANLVSEVWGRTGDSIRSYLAGSWDKDKQNLAADLVRHIPATICPDGNSWLNLKLLEEVPEEGEDLLQRLEETARSCARSTDAEKRTADVLRLARERLREPGLLAEALGRMAEAAHVAEWASALMADRREVLTEQELAAYGWDDAEVFFTAYREALRPLEPARQYEVRRKVAEAGVVHVLFRELAAELLPWDEQKSPEHLAAWQTQLMDHHAGLLDGVRRQLAGLLAHSRQAGGVLLLAEKLLPAQTGKGASPGLVALCAAVVKQLPLLPLPGRLSESLACVLEQPASESAARLRILKLLYAIERKAENPSWSTETFPHADPIWMRDVRSLDRAEKTGVVEWCLDTFTATGVTAPGQAWGLIQLLKAAGMESEVQIADAASRLLRGRDSVTCVLTIMAFARLFLQGVQPESTGGGVIGTLAQRCDPTTHRLLLDHLAKRFCRADEAYVQRLRQLCREAGLPAVGPAELAGRPKEVRQDARAGGGGAARAVSAWVKRLWGGAGKE